MTEQLKPLGSNVPLYLESKGYSARQTRQILQVANEMASLRGTRIIYLDFVMVADGTIRENQMGGDLVGRTRRAIRRQRGVGLPAGRVVQTEQPQVRPRRKRKRA